MDDRAARAPRRVIVTADDMGMHAPWDAAIAAAVERGVVTSVSMMTSGTTYSSARALASALGADVGIHLDLVSGRPLSGSREVRTLVDRAGAFPGRWSEVVSRYVRRELALDEVELEWDRQVRRALEDGVSATHLNGHYHLHLLPALFRIAVGLARRFGIRYVRIPDERPRDAKTAMLWGLGRRARRLHPDGAIVHCRGNADAGRLGTSEWARLLGSLAPGVTEIVCHPGQAAREDAALRSDALRAELAGRATSFRALMGGSPVPLGHAAEARSA